MKYNKIISITLANALFLLFFASLLASCQKNSLTYSGHFTDYSLASRSIASVPSSRKVAVGSKKIQLTQWMDPKQIVIYCKINSVNTEQCFRQFFNEKVLELKRNNKIKSIDKISYHDYFFKAQKDVAAITQSILTKLDTKVNKYVKNRHDFCAKNAHHNLKKCLYHSTESDSMFVLNNYQQQVPRLNGQEYLYLKFQINNKMKEKLHLSYNQLKQIK
jgi:hypothetical protein